MIAPTRIMPWIALAPVISGVCRVVDTLETTSKPTNTASTKIVSRVMPSISRPLPASVERSRGLVPDHAVVDDAGAGEHLVVQVDDEPRPR